MLLKKTKQHFEVWILAPEIETDDPNLKYYYDFDQSIEEYTRVFAELQMSWVWQPIRLSNAQDIIKSIRKKAFPKVPIVLNLCDGDEANHIPGISIIQLLDEEQLIYTGADTAFYEITTSKLPMKQAFDQHGVPTAPWMMINPNQVDADQILSHCGIPCIIKPAISAGSMGLGVINVVHNKEEVNACLDHMRAGYRNWDVMTGGVFAERFITGREFTTLITGHHQHPGKIKVYAPAERIFNATLPPEEQFLSFDRLWEYHEQESPLKDNKPLYEYAPVDLSLHHTLERISKEAFIATGGTGYARIDIRMDANTGQCDVLEVNAQCGLSEDENYTSIGAILRFSGATYTQLIFQILEEAVDRHTYRQWKVCVLQPDYSTSAVDYQYYDPPRDLTSLLPGALVHHVFLNKLTTYRQLKELKDAGYDIFVNLCEGYLEWEVPSIDVIYTCEILDLPFTGPTTKLYDPPKELMKYVAFAEGVKSPPYALIEADTDLAGAIEQLKYPLFIKPAKAGDSLGINEHNCVYNFEQLDSRIQELLPEYPELLVEEYIAGREFTVLVAAQAKGGVKSFKPVEYVFPEGCTYKTYALKTSALHPDCNIPCQDLNLERKLRRAAERIFKSFGGVGYGRCDFRVDKNNKVYFLEINFTCSVFYADGYEGSADYILRYDGIGQAGFLRMMIEEGIARHKSAQKKYVIRNNGVSGYGIYAARDMKSGEVIFAGEEKSQRIVTLRHVEKNWSEKEKETFRRYAYPISEQVYLLWDNDPTQWAPQNHHCDANTVYDGLNVVTNRKVRKGEELTLDYATFLDETMEPFTCTCNSTQCRGTVRGTYRNTITEREEFLRSIGVKV